jgi:putative endonuclease
MNDVTACVYMMASISRVIFIGSTIDLEGRVLMHKQKYYPKSFTKKYACTKLVYYEAYETLDEARQRERQMKKWRRSKKVGLIESMNPRWTDLSLSWDIIQDAAANHLFKK